MSARRFASRQEAKRIFTTSKVTTNFRHLLPVAKPKHIVTPNPLDKSQRAVSPKDRIKWWNIVPGDQVRVMAETDGSVREVKGVNKFTNRVYIEGDKKVCLFKMRIASVKCSVMVLLTIHFLKLSIEKRILRK